MNAEEIVRPFMKVKGTVRTNGIVNLQIQAPTADAYTLHVVYNYNCTVVVSKGSAELLF